MTQPTPLRFGVMTGGSTIRAWQARCLEALLAMPGVEPAVLIVDGRDPPSKRSGLARLRGREGVLWDAFNNLYVARRSRALERVPLPESLAGLPQVRCNVERRGRFSEYFSSEDLDAIRDHRLDFVLRFAFGIIRGEILEVPRLGVWSFHHDDEERYRGGPPAFWEVATGDVVTGAVLQRLTERLDGGVVLEKGHFRTVLHSYVRNTDDVHFGSAEWPAKVCRQLGRGVGPSIDGVPSTSTAPIYRKPTNGQMVRFMGRLAATFVRSQVRSVMVSDQWNVGIVDAPIESFLVPSFRPEPRWLGSERGRSRYVADPFGTVTPGGAIVALVESYDRRTRQGVIEWLDVDGARPAKRGPALAVDEHASYPFLFSHDGDVFCAPQLGRSRGVHVYRATSFPTDWEAVAVIADGTRAIDPTVLRHDGRWWLFFTDGDAGALTKLHIWWSDELVGEWHPHPANPVKTDIRSARPAGTPFMHDGALYRPAQDCSRTYGGSISINRVIELSPTEFREELASVVSPPADARFGRGTHTLSSVNGQTLVDAKRHVFSVRGTLAELRARTRRRA